ncbi:arylesterase [Planktotalea sp.]|uniref:arylesterase n=1 Tax=Planktotalea sp. TaxID=2029877 RepID=UPI003D6AD869
MKYGILKGANKAFVSIALIFILLGTLALPARANPLTVVAFGDSLTQGYGLRSDDGFVPQLAQWLYDNGVQSSELRLINAGVSGDTTAGGAARIEWTLTEDVDAMILALGGNDLLRGIDPAISRANLERIIQAANARAVPVLLVGLVGTSNYGPEYKAEFDKMYPELSAQHSTLYAQDFFAGLLEADGTVDRDAVRARMQADGIHPNREGVRDIVRGLGPSVLELIDRARNAR